MRKISLVACALMLASCASSTIEMVGKIDSAEKTITMAPGNGLLLGPFKQGLRAAGWRIAVDRGPVRTTGSTGFTTDLESGTTFKTRYRLALSQRQIDVCLGTGLPMVSYDLSLIDNASGEEVLTASGKDCTDLATQWFLGALNSDGKSYCTSSLGRSCNNKSR